MSTDSETLVFAQCFSKVSTIQRLTNNDRFLHLHSNPVWDNKDETVFALQLLVGLLKGVEKIR